MILKNIFLSICIFTIFFLLNEINEMQNNTFLTSFTEIKSEQQNNIVPMASKIERMTSKKIILYKNNKYKNKIRYHKGKK